MDVNKNLKITTIGLVGLGLMGQGIAASLIASGFNVLAYSRTPAREEETKKHIADSLAKMAKKNILPLEQNKEWEKRFNYVNSLENLEGAQFVVETVGESLELKRKIFKTLEVVVEENVVIATNTSGISLTVLQKEFIHKERFLGMHWAEPAEISRYLELSPAKNTDKDALEIAVQIGKRCGKQPTVLNYDVSGLISNRLMYAMMREAIHLVESGVADVETVDRSFRNDIGWWATLCGPFRWMDLTGLPIYAEVMKGLLPKLNNTTELPELMKEKVESKTKFYDYSDISEEEWENIWTDFTYDIRKLIEKYDNPVN